MKRQLVRLFVGASIFTFCLALMPGCNTPPTAEQLNAYTNAAATVNNAALEDYKTIHAIKHSK